MAKVEKWKAGDRFKIKVNGETFETIIDENCVQRFPDNRFVSLLMTNGMNHGLSYNELAVMAARGMITQDERRQIYRITGMSVSGYQDVFPQDKIKNPLWD